MTSVHLESNISKAAGDAIQWQSLMTIESAVRQYSRLS